MLARLMRLMRRKRSRSTVIGAVGVILLSLVLLFMRAPSGPAGLGIFQNLLGSAPDASQLCGDAVEWETVWERPEEHTGDVVAVTGQIAATNFATSVGGQPTFLNLGNPHPRTPRMDAVIWGDSRADFLAEYPEGPEIRLDSRQVCIAGTVQMHEGVPQIELRDPVQVHPKGW